MIDLLNFSLADIIDILLVGVLIYQIYRLIKGTAALNIFIGIIIIYLCLLYTLTLPTICSV